MKNQPSSPLTPMTPLKKKKALKRKMTKLLKQQEHFDEEKEYLPGKLEITASQYCKPQMVDFFGDIHTQCFCLHTNTDQKMVAAGCSNGDVKVYDLSEGKLMMMANTSRLSGFPNTGLRWNPVVNQELAACNCDGTIKWYNTDKQMAIAHHQAQTGYLCAEYNCDGTWSVFGNENHDIEIYDSEKKKLLQKFQGGTLDSFNPNHTNRVFCLKRINDDPNLFFSAAWDDTVRLWDVRIPDTYVRKFSGPSVTADSLDLKGNVLLVGNYSNKNPVQMWDFGKGELIQNIDICEQNPGSSYCFGASYAHKSKKNIFAVALSGVNKVKVFQNKTLISQIRFQAAPLCLDFYQFNNKDFMVASGNEGTIYAIKLKMIQPS